MLLTIDLHEHLVQVPSPLRPGPQLLGALLADLGSKHRAEPVPPQTNGLVANIDATLVKQVLDIS